MMPRQQQGNEIMLMMSNFFSPATSLWIFCLALINVCLQSSFITAICFHFNIYELNRVAKMFLFFIFSLFRAKLGNIFIKCFENKNKESIIKIAINFA
jgi:hypothetical protein